MRVESPGRTRVPVSAGCLPAAPCSGSPGCGNLGKQEHWYVRAENPGEREPGGGGQGAVGRNREPGGDGQAAPGAVRIPAEPELSHRQGELASRG